MPGPTPDPVTDPRASALETMKRAKFPMLATVDPEGQPRVRPVSPVRTEDFTVYVANLRQYGKTRELAANPRCELCYLDDTHDQVRITGTAAVLTDATMLDAIWQSNPLLRRYLGTPDNPDLIIYRITPHQVRFMREWALTYYEVDA
ncbi:MAG TPA: pyridoxamine 5'-phosphate oxidase family protein [Chthoniobacteraceae bacterium]|nr:pyridoxamine 5'-phosphate oxidase family protein [Chthoniobacteraceae bacterium]